MPRVLGIDPSLRGTGYAVIEGADARDARLLAGGTISNGRALSQAECLVEIRRVIAEVITAHHPDDCAVEGVIWVQNNKTAIILGAARGASLIAAGEVGLPIYEYAPKRAKQAVVGKGTAQKEQVAFMVRALLKLTETPPPDVADACAIALAHLQAVGTPEAEKARL